MKNSNYYQVTLLSILVILAFSTFTPTLAFAAPLANNDKDWQYVNGNSWAWNYSPQTQINKDNVGNLEVKWLFPLGSKALAPAGMQAIQGFTEGTTTPPVVRDGTVYVNSNWGRMYAIDGATGKQKWTYDYVLNFSDVRKKLPVEMGGIIHDHGFRYWESGDALLSYGLACDFYGVDAKTGKQKFWVKDLCLDVPGNLGLYRPSLANSAVIGTYEKGRQFIVVFPSRIHSNVAQVTPRDSRHVTMGISMDAPNQILWRVYSSPPQDQPVKDWAINECSSGYFRDIPCTEALAANRAGLEWDFALPNQPIGWYGGVTANWGQPVVDEDTGLMYTQTGNQGPYSNMTLAPGPRLFGSTIMAIDLNAGKRVWWLQPFPHDPYDYDCNWSGLLTENPTLGKVYIYGCKEGRYFVMDAATGKPKLTVDVRKDQYARGQISSDPSKLIYEPDPRSYYDMREWNWISYPAKNVGEPGKFCTLPCTVYPDWYNGIFAADRAINPVTQTYYLHEDALQATVTREYGYFPGETNYASGNLFDTLRPSNTNSTIVARDIATGKVKWAWFFPYSHQRAAPVVTGGMVFSGFTDGTMKFLDEGTGKVINEIIVGAPVVVQPTVGKDSQGNSKIFAIIGATRLAGAANFGLGGQSDVPGTIIALGLSAKTTAGSTSATTVATTVTTTAPAQTVTTTASSETIGPITYAAIGIAVIAIIAAAVLATRKKQ
ncbi:MAG: PQQ-binding-like beta-propeller repeat protein [Thaumarchaeota archaeon]|nr:PQQ-binding-like beta-propeller repeat protein [Nitrososphaerota archaeon]